MKAQGLALPAAVQSVSHATTADASTKMAQVTTQQGKDAPSTTFRK